MLRVLKYRSNQAKCSVVLISLLLIAVCAFAQTPDWQWAIGAGGSDHDYGEAITVDDAGNSYVTGYFSETATFGSNSITSNGDVDIFVAKMDINGNWVWAIRAGGIDRDSGFGIVVDDIGNSYVTGSFEGSATFGLHSLTSEGGKDIFVAKIDQNGVWQWATNAGGTNPDYGTGITMDTAGNSYVTGSFEGSATFGLHSLTSEGSKDIFVAKIDQNGVWQWATSAGGIDRDSGFGIVVDDIGNSYVTGSFEGSATFGSYSLTGYGSDDIFVAKIDQNGVWQWATSAGGTNPDYGTGITINDESNCYMTGIFYFTATFGSYSITSSGMADICVAKIDQNGVWQWAEKAGGSSTDHGEAITIDDAGNSYITGGFEGVAYFGSDSLTSYGGRDIFVAKIDSTGMWEWSINSGGILSDIGCSITINNENSCWVTGFFEDISTFGTHSITSSGGSDIFVAKLESPVSSDPEIMPDAFNLSNHPNPFNTNTTINYSLKQDSPVSLEIYNLKGQLVEILLNDNIQAGDHKIEWDCQRMPSGVYFLKMKTGNEESTRKMILLK